MVQQRIARFTRAGVADAEVSDHPFATADGLTLNLTRFRRAACDDVVLLVHGLTPPATCTSCRSTPTW